MPTDQGDKQGPNPTVPPGPDDKYGPNPGDPERGIPVTCYAPNPRGDDGGNPEDGGGTDGGTLAVYGDPSDATPVQTSRPRRPSARRERCSSPRTAATGCRCCSRSAPTHPPAGSVDPSSIGRDVSHGCVRVPNDVTEKLNAVVPLGTPVTIH